MNRTENEIFLLVVDDYGAWERKTNRLSSLITKKHTRTHNAQYACCCWRTQYSQLFRTHHTCDTKYPKLFIFIPNTIHTISKPQSIENGRKSKNKDLLLFFFEL